MDVEIVERQLSEMARLQEHHNREVAEDWRERGFEYHRAVWVECAELLDHYGWKWWKHQQPDLEQVRLEIVDIWHFGLSMLLRDGEIGVDDVAAVAARFVERVGATREQDAFRTDVEALAAAALTAQRFSVDAFIDVMNALGMSFDLLFEQYVGKNVLNNFRQHHGYRQGSYRKLWNGREDNEHLVELLAELDPAAEDFSEQLYAALERRYADAG